MKLLQVLIEHKLHSLDRPFSYVYYGIKNVEKGFRVYIEFNKQMLVGYVLEVEETNKTKQQLEEENGFEINEIFDVLDTTPLLNEELLLLADKISSYYVAPRIGVLQSMLPNTLSPRKSALKGPKIKYETYFKIKDPYNEEDLTSKQVEVLRLIRQEQPIRKKDIFSSSVAEKLLTYERIEEIRKEVRRLAIPDYVYEEPPILTNDQNRVIDEINASNDKTYLIHGVTGSGKTEIYLKLVEQTIKQGKGVIFLVPEISLTPMMMEYLLKRFKNNVAILHGELTPGEKYDEYRKIATGECNIVIGARSAIFAPVHNLGLIIIDEEHVESYKQDINPYYHAREVAIMRSEITGAKVILGSATPSLETMARAVKGVYHLLKLEHRINAKPLPKATIINLSDRRNIDRESYMFSIPLRKAIKETLEKKEQVILLLNRRGFSTNLVCRNCGHTFTCPDCGIALTYHKTDNMLKCHHCDYVMELPETCPECGSKYLMKTGFGSERVEEEVHKLFPNAKVLRIDSDSTKNKNKLPSMIEAFRKKEYDIMIGTQMIAKGHDFPSVSLVGLVLADIGLSMPSYRSSERVFQLITQAIGRCGRGDIPGRAIIQSYLPNHYSITLGAKQDYKTFYLTEMNNRKELNYPPFFYLSSISITGRNLDNVEINAEIARQMLEEDFEETNSIIIGPITPFYQKTGDKYERQLLVKYKDSKLGNDIFTSLVDYFKLKNCIEIFINIDPYNF